MTTVTIADVASYEVLKSHELTYYWILDLTPKAMKEIYFQSQTPTLSETITYVASEFEVESKLVKSQTMILSEITSYVTNISTIDSTN